jgi:hypothetical protein
MAKFSLFRQEEKRNEKSPDYSGGIEVLETEVAELVEHLQRGPREDDYQGRRVVKLRMGAWLKESKNGKKYLGGSVTIPQEQQTARPSVPEPLPEDIPF